MVAVTLSFFKMLFTQVGSLSTKNKANIYSSYNYEKKAEEADREGRKVRKKISKMD